MIVPVILSGGSGTRLWPLSRPGRPKQLLAMVDERTMLRATFDRLNGIPEMADPWVVCNADHHQLVARELFAAGFKPDNVILEPIGRNTAPAAAAAAMTIAAQAPDALMLLLPADHVIADEVAFRRAVGDATGVAEDGHLVTFGIVPSYPETGYGYIEVGQPVSSTARKVSRFVEKPDSATAERYVASGDFLWNSGMFLFPVTRYLDELERFEPDMTNAVAAAVRGADRKRAIALDAEEFAACPANSIDFAVMERTESAVVVSLDAGWSDVGSWAALWELEAEDSATNVLVGDVAAVDVTGSYIRSEGRLVAAIGLDDVVIVETDDAVMVAPRHRSQDVKEMVSLLKGQGRREADAHMSEIHSWGMTETLIDEPGYAVKRLTVEPSSQPIVLPAAPSARTWVVLEGAGKVEVDGQAVDITCEGLPLGAGAVAALRVEGSRALRLLEISRDA